MRVAGGFRWAIGVMLLSLLAACGGDGDKASTATDASSEPAKVLGTVVTATSTTSTTLLPADQKVVDSYRAMWAAVRRALDPPDPASAGLAATHTGPALDAVVTQVQTVHARGAVMRGPVELHPKVISRTETEATIEDCIVDKGHMFDPETGKRIDTDQPDVVYNHATTRMVLVDGTWKRQSSEQLQTPCTPS